MSDYETACRIVCAVTDADAAEIAGVLGPASRRELERLVLMLASMVPDDAPSPRDVVEARSRFLGASEEVGLDVDTSPLALVLSAVAEVFQVEPLCVTASRDRLSTEARHVLCWIRYTVHREAYLAIGRSIGRDHTTVMNAVERVNRSPELRAKANLVLARLREEAA